MQLGRRVGVFAAAIALLLSPASALAHNGVLSGGEQYEERCGPANTDVCAVYRVKVTGDHGYSAFLHGDPNAFDLFAGIQEANVTDATCNKPISGDWGCSQEQVTRLRVCLGHDTLGILKCEDHETTAQDFATQVYVVAWPANHITCPLFYMQTEAWGVNFHMPFKQERMPCG